MFTNFDIICTQDMVVIGQLKPLILIDQVSINPILVLLLQYYAANQPLHHCSTHWHQLSNILCNWMLMFANKCTYYLKSQLLCLKLLQIKINKSLLLYLGISFISQPRVLSLGDLFAELTTFHSK